MIFRKAIRDRAFEPFAAALTASERSTVEISSFVILLVLSTERVFFGVLSLSLSLSLTALRFLPPFRIRAFDSALNSFSKRRSTTLSKKKQKPRGGKATGKKGGESYARATGLQTGMESKKLRNDGRTRYFGCTRHEWLRRKKGTTEKRGYETEQQEKKTTLLALSSKLRAGSALIQMC